VHKHGDNSLMSEPVKEAVCGPVLIELAPGQAYTFDAMPMHDAESLQLYIDWRKSIDADEDLDRGNFFPRFYAEARKNLSERYSPEEVETAMKLIRCDERPGSPWSRIITVLSGLG
jgi:hypothetical protein